MASTKILSARSWYMNERERERERGGGGGDRQTSIRDLASDSECFDI